VATLPYPHEVRQCRIAAEAVASSHRAHTFFHCGHHLVGTFKALL
jgi:hypothetical protein